MSFLFSRKADPENKDPQEPVPSVTEPYDVKIGVSDEHRKHIAAILQSIYANTWMLKLQTTNMCFNLKGVNTFQLQKMLRCDLKTLSKSVKRIGTKIRSIGYFVPGDIREFQKIGLTLQEISGEKVAKQDDHELLKSLLNNHESLIRAFTKYEETIRTKYKCLPISDFVLKLIRNHYKMSWILRSHLDQRRDRDRDYDDDTEERRRRRERERRRRRDGNDDEPEEEDEDEDDEEQD